MLSPSKIEYYTGYEEPSTPKEIREIIKTISFNLSIRNYVLRTTRKNNIQNSFEIGAHLDKGAPHKKVEIYTRNSHLKNELNFIYVPEMEDIIFNFLKDRNIKEILKDNKEFLDLILMVSGIDGILNYNNKLSHNQIPAKNSRFIISYIEHDLITLEVLNTVANVFNISHINLAKKKPLSQDFIAVFLEWINQTQKENT